MNDKLDPVLDERVERAASTLASRGAERVDVIVALRREADDDTIADLAERGFAVRAVVGDILTGSVDLADVTAVAGSDDVVKIDAGGLLSPEPADSDPPLDSAFDVSEPGSPNTFSE